MSRRFLIIATFLLACVSPSLGQHYIAPTIVNNLGQPVPNASIRVCTEPAVGYPCTNPATLYTCIAQNGTCPSPNPITGDADGNFDFYGTTNLIYHFEITGPSLTPYIQSYVYMPGPSSSGGGVCGILYDVQINDPLGLFGCDSGVFTENPSTHTVSDTVVNATNELEVSDPTHTGTINIGSSNGTSIVANFVQSLSPTFSTSGGGYGMDWPDSAALGVLTITSLTPGTDGRLPTVWIPISSGVVTAVTGVAPIASTGGSTPAISLQNSASVNVTAALGTDTKYFTASGSASTFRDLIVGDASGGIVDSGDLQPQGIAIALHQWLNSYTQVTGAFTQSQPACGDLSNSGTMCLHNTDVSQNVVGTDSSGNLQAGSTSFSQGITDIAPISGDQVMIIDAPVGVTLTSVACGTQNATSAVIDLKPASESAWGTLGSSILSGTITCTPSGATGTITTTALTANTPLMVVVGTVSGSVANLYVRITYTRGF
jgi:hypothetical protein